MVLKAEVKSLAYVPTVGEVYLSTYWKFEEVTKILTLQKWKHLYVLEVFHQEQNELVFTGSE